MSHDIKLWQVDAAEQATSVASSTSSETEDWLERVLARNPDMLSPGLTLVGRQTPLSGGYLDLLGVDRDGRLVVFELKRAKLTRDAVAQVIDYGSDLDALADADLAALVAEHSGRDDTTKVENLEEWYQLQHEGDWTDLRPTRLVLVGLGADDRASRMIEYLTERGVDIALLTFSLFRDGGRTLLARHVVEEADAVARSGHSPTQSQRRSSLDERARELGIADLWQEAVDELGGFASASHATALGITFRQSRIVPSRNRPAQGSHSVVVDPRSGKIKVTFYPAAIHVCLKKKGASLAEFKAGQEPIPFQFEEPPNAYPTDLVDQQWYCLLDAEAWAQHRSALVELAKTVQEAWMEFGRDETSG